MICIRCGYAIVKIHEYWYANRWSGEQQLRGWTHNPCNPSDHEPYTPELIQRELVEVIHS